MNGSAKKNRAFPVRLKRTSIILAVAAGINLIPSTTTPALATAIAGATFPQQVVHEATSLSSYATELQTTMATVSTEMNTLNSYMTQLQNMTSLPTQSLSQITMPYQQAMYDYQQATGLMSYYQQLYGNLNNISGIVQQQNLDIVNSALSPQDYANAVYASNSQQAQAAQQQFQSAANSMQAADALGPEIAAQQAKIPGFTAGNTVGQQTLASELGTIEQQNQLLLAGMNQAQMAKSQQQMAAEARVSAQAQQMEAINANNQAVAAGMQASEDATAASTSAAQAQWQQYLNCINNGNYTCVQ